MKLPFHKLDGAGNDFVCLDWRGKTPLVHEEAAELGRILCNRFHGIGADGLMFLEDPTEKGTQFTMRHVNADGSHAAMCGNGSRCIARYAIYLGAAPTSMSFLTGAGVYRADVFPDEVRTHFPPVENLPVVRHLEGPMRPFPTAIFLPVGVPHAVLFVNDIDLVDADSAGRAVRHDPAFAPHGTNANFAQEINGTIRVRTYERGVEGETQACGTGSVATACCFAHGKGMTGPVRIPVIPTGGIALAVTLTPGPRGFHDITLAGPAEITFQGEAIVDLEKKRLRFAEIPERVRVPA